MDTDVGRKCPKCAHVRQTDAIAEPGYCPACGVFYAKAERLLAEGKLKVVLAAEFDKGRQESATARVEPTRARDPQPAQESAKAVTQRAQRASRPRSRVELVGITIVGSILLLPMLALLPNSESTSRTGPGESRDWVAVKALNYCRESIKKMAVDPESASVPIVENFGKGDEFYYAWGASTSFARMKNPLGLDVAVSASCIGSISQQRITSLTVNGRSIIGD